MGLTNAHLENRLEAYFRSAVRRHLGGITVKLAPTQKGIPDRLVMLPPGRIYLVELKQENGSSLSPIQRVWHQRAAELGVRVYTLYGRPDIDEWVKEMAREFDEPDIERPRKRRGRPPKSATG